MKQYRITMVLTDENEEFKDLNDLWRFCCDNKEDVIEYIGVEEVESIPVIEEYFAA